MTQIRIAAFVTSRKIGMGHSLEFPTVRRWNSVPGFRLAKMQEINGVEIHVLGVPGERGFPHAEIEIGRVDAVDLDAVVVVDVVENGTQVIYVPFLHRVGIRRMNVNSMN